MTSRRIGSGFLIGALLWVAACATVPITGRQQLDLVPRSTMLTTSYQQYDRFLEENELSDNRRLTELVHSVGRDIQTAVEHYFQEKNMAHQLEGYRWEFHLVAGDEVNAFAMPGGKIVVYEGIMEIAEDANGLAVIMGHEVAHAVAGHGSERLSQQLVTQLGGMALSLALTEKPAATQQLWMAAFGMGAQVGFLLPYSRLHESEADHLGLIFMAKAGYDPRAAIDFWQRMEAEKKGQAPPEFLSTHPASGTRIEQIEAWMPEVMPIYRRNKGQRTAER
jgi:predicted Zn-dependent protease